MPNYLLKHAQSSDWLDQFLTDFEKKAVEVVEHKDLYSDMFNLLNLTSRTGHKTVAAITDFYAEQTGLSEYLKTISNKKASELPTEQDPLPGFNSHLKDSIIIFLKNRIKTFHGEISIPALKSELMTMFGNQGLKSEDVNTDEMVKFIYKLIEDERASNSAPRLNYDLGKDQSHDADGQDHQKDFFAGLEPVSAQLDEDEEDFESSEEEKELIAQEDAFWKEKLSNFSDDQLMEFLKDGAGENLVLEKLPDNLGFEFTTHTPKGKEIRMGRGINYREALEKAVMYFWQ